VARPAEFPGDWVATGGVRDAVALVAGLDELGTRVDSDTSEDCAVGSTEGVAEGYTGSALAVGLAVCLAGDSVEE
jgi:hypothetical protein